MDLREHLSRAGKARWAKQTKEARSAHAKMMSAKRWGIKDDRPKLPNQQTNVRVV